MRIKLFFAILLPCTLCAGQSVLTTPDGVNQSTPANTQAPGNETVPAQRPVRPVNLISDGSAPNVQQPLSQETRVPFVGPTRIVGPLRTKSEFQQYAEDATGRRLSVYGRKLFDQVPTTFAPVENVPVPADYVLGPGDQLLIRAWGKIELDSRVTVDRNGQINLPKVGTLSVAGLRYSQVETYLHSALSAMFKDFELNVALGQLRTIQIFMLGEARQPGAYTVSSLSTMVDALFTSGGPSATGSMRKIQLRRDGKTVSEFDLYDLIAKGDKSHDVRLLPGDVIFIPPIGAQIAISGDVNLPGIYELNGETTVAAALLTAGGMTSLADGERAVLERIESHRSRAMEEFPLDAEGQQRLVKDGDLLRVFPLSPKISNAVTLRGNVAEPGLYPWKAGMRVSDLIPNRDSLITRNYWNRQNHLVSPIQDHPFASQRIDAFGNERSEPYGNLRDPDRSNQRTQGSENRNTRETESRRMNDSQDGSMNRTGTRHEDGYGDPRAVGAGVQESSPDKHDLSSDRVSSSVATIGKNSAEINWEYAVIERLDEQDLSTHLIPFRLASAIDNSSSADNQILKPGDVVTIFSRADLELPMEKHATFVRVGGEVNAPGVYRVNAGQTLKDVVQMAGGLTPHSYRYASIFTRVSTRVAQETQLRQSADQMQRDLVSKFANATPQAGQTGNDQQAQLALQQAALARLTSIKPTGRVVLSLRPEAAAIGDIPDLPLEDGDAFYIPPRLSTVTVVGAVYNANAFRFESEQRLITYLSEAGGPTRDADAKRMFVIRADGTVVSSQSRNMHSHGKYENLKLLPGDAIVVPEKLRVSSKMNEFLQWSQFSSQLALTAAALNVIK